MARAKIGDVIEIKTEKGLAYAQYTHNHTAPPRYGQLIRVFDGLHEKQPDNLNVLVRGSILFLTFFPLHSALSRSIFRVVGNVAVPQDAQSFPIFRMKGLVDPVTKKALRWALWDGESEKMLERPLTDAEKSLPILGVVNDTMLVDRIVSGWRSEYDIHT